MAYPYQVSNKFRVGIEGQYGAAKYRLIHAKPITTGYATSLGLPLTIRLLVQIDCSASLNQDYDQKKI